MRIPYIDSEELHGLHAVWHLKEFTLDFTDRERYKKAVKILMNSKKYKLLSNGRYLYGNTYGYVTFRAK